MNSIRRVSLVMCLVGAIVSGATEAGLAAELERLARQSPDRVWLSYTVPMLEGEHSLCCHDEDGHGAHRQCDLDDRSYSVSHSEEVVPDEDRRLRVYLGLDDGELVQVQAYDTGCRITARRGTVHQVGGIVAADSVAFLSGQLRADREKVRDGALMAIAFHADPAATVTLTAATRPGEPAELRENAAFWLGATRAEGSFDTLRRMVQEDPSDEVREHVVFAISLGESQRTTDYLLDLARTDDDTGVRGQALFWLGQKAGERVAETLQDAAFEDPNLEVKEQAVFALSQLADGAGVTRLIEVATTHDHPEIRRAALFWLGQSRDPRALDLFERILQ